MALCQKICSKHCITLSWIIKKKLAVKSPSTSLPLFLPPKEVKLAKNKMNTKVPNTTSYWIKILEWFRDLVSALYIRRTREVCLPKPTPQVWNLKEVNPCHTPITWYWKYILNCISHPKFLSSSDFSVCTVQATRKRVKKEHGLL